MRILWKNCVTCGTPQKIRTLKQNEKGKFWMLGVTNMAHLFKGSLMSTSSLDIFKLKKKQNISSRMLSFYVQSCFLTSLQRHITRIYKLYLFSFFLRKVF